MDDLKPYPKEGLGLKKTDEFLGKEGCAWEGARVREGLAKRVKKVMVRRHLYRPSWLR